MQPRSTWSGLESASRLGWTLASCGACAAFGLFLVAPAQAATPAYDGSIISFSAPRELTPGQTVDVVVTIKNIGSKTWHSSGANFVSLYHWNPVSKVETTSLFSTPAWNSDKRPSLLPTGSLAPGQSVNFHIALHAPNAPGTYQEPFILCAENAAWMKDTKLTLDLTIKGTPAKAPQPPPVAPVSVSPPAVPAATSQTSAPQVSAGWSAQLAEKQGSQWQIDPGDHVIVVLGFKNTGTKTWTNDGANYVSMYSVDGNNKERASNFQDYNWLSPSHAVKLREASVKPGEIGHFLLELRPKLPGSYNETFELAAENISWIGGSPVALPITVPLTSDFIATAPPGSDMITSVPIDQAPYASSGEYRASLLLRSAENLTLSGNGREQLTFGFKNTGAQTWNALSLRVKGIQPAIVGKLTSSVQDDSWPSSAEPVHTASVTKPGEVGFLSFKVKAPTLHGSYTASFQLYADNQQVDGGGIDIPITVTADGYRDPNAPTQKAPTPSPSTNTSPPASNQPSLNPVPLNGDVSSLPAEPIIRVGLFRTADDQMVVNARFAPFTVTQNGTTVCRVNTGVSVTVRYDRTNKVYKLSGGSCGGQSSGVYQLRTDDGVSPMEISDFSHTLSWLPGANDNTFRAELELRYTPSTDSVWVINELPIEWYLKGIGETSNSSPQEYQRALLTAARTYAMYHVERGTKHADEDYTVDATYDQVYRGYGAESRDGNVVAAVDATRGQIVTYNGQLAITPYYSRSDGRTRSWTEVWGGGPYPWLVSVPVPWDQGKTLFGHGVGMSATGALGAANDGWTYDRILKYFYPQTELRRAYK